MNKENISIVFLGDIYLGDQPSIELSPEVRKILTDADLVVGNQEGPITDLENAVGGKCCLRSAPQTAKILSQWGIDVVSLANNHMFDYGWEGFEHTREWLKKEQFQYFGAGANLAEASKPLILKIHGLKIGLLTYSWGFVQTTCATENSFGCSPLNDQLMIEQIQQLKNQVDMVIIQPHWGYCEYLYPTPQQVELGKRLIAAGATAVIGHHSHVVQGLAAGSDSLIAYSLGNFAFAEYTDRGRSVKMTVHDRRGIIFKVSLTRNKISCDKYFTILKNNVVQFENTPGRERDFAHRSEVFCSGDYGDHWRRYTRIRLLKRILYWCNILNWRYMHVETFIGGWLMLKGIFQKRSCAR